jgi:predicted CoA-binding protein
MRVMVVGASINPEKYGNRAVRAYLRRGHEVLAVNPRLARDRAKVEGLEVYGDVTQPPGPIDRVTVYLPPSMGLGILDDLAARGDVGEVWFNPGAESPEIVERARELGLEVVMACSIVDIGEVP